MSAPMRAHALQLFVLRDGDLAASELFAEGSYTIGREGDCDVVLDHAAVTPLQLEFREGRVRLSGSGGFHHNGQRVAEAEVNTADDIWLGPYLLKTRLVGRKKSAGTSPGKPNKQHRSSSGGGGGSGNLALALVPEEPQPAIQLDPDDVDQLLASALADPAEPIEIDEEEAARILTPLADLTDLNLDGEELLDVLPLELATGVAMDDLADLDLEDVPIEEGEPEDLALELATEAHHGLPPRGATPPLAQPAARATPPAPQPMARATPPAPRQDAPLAARAAAATRAPTSAPGLLATSGTPVGLLHARIFWGDTLLFSRSFSPDAKVFTDSADAAALQLYGFAPLTDAPLVRTAGSSWSVQLPMGSRAFQRASSGWTAAEASASRELRLSFGNAVRLSNERFHLELSAQPAPVQALARFGKGIDLGLLALIVVLGLGLGIFLRTLPPVSATRALEPEIIRHVQMTIEKHEAPKRSKPKPLPDPAAVQKPAPTPIAQATNLKQAGVPLRSLDKITRATKGLSSLLASLTATAPTGGGRRDALAMLPSMGRAPAPLPGLGGTGAGGSIGPVTKGGELLRGGIGGLLAGATGGRGAVSGVPVSVPSRPTRVQGSIDRDLVAKVINEKVSEMRGCYERAMLRDPNLGAGKVLLEWTIDGRGDVSEVRTKTATLKSPEVVSCLLDLLRTLKFPRPNGGVVIVSYPVLFNSVGY